jgi:hypothetical protein
VIVQRLFPLSIELRLRIVWRGAFDRVARQID